jgi:asparagine synthase (glutamine-hydrolysing)
MISLNLAIRAARELGPGSLALYGLYQTLLRSGWLRWRTPVRAWDSRTLAWWLAPGKTSDPQDYVRHRSVSSPDFFFKLDSQFVTALREAIGGSESSGLIEADEILSGRFRLFGASAVGLGFPPDWAAYAPMRDTEEGGRVETNHHWTTYTDLNLLNDVKLLWEVSRFGWIYPLARAFLLTEDERYAEGMWSLVKSWRDVNPPNVGPHWASAQEVAIRLMAQVFAVYAFMNYWAHNPVRLTSLVQMIAEHADRIPHTLTYARAQGNNHLITEAVGLFTTGLLFPEFRYAAQWKRLGRSWLIHALERQFFPDGGYIQHSSNYHRLALQAGLWAIRLAEIHDEPFPSAAVESLRAGTRCLAAQVEGENGAAPNFGPNDGAHILPLSTCRFGDFRPTLQTASWVLFGEPLFGNGSWDEAHLWLGIGSQDQETSYSRARGRAPTQQKPDPPHASADLASISQDSFTKAGLYFMRGEHAWGMLRCVRFKSRPGHSDQLHFDLWWRGINILGDPGTYLYTGSPPWNNGLMGASVHNALVVDGVEPMHRAGRFLWLNWAQGNMLGRWRSAEGSLEVLSAEHEGYRRLGIIHRRTVLRIEEDLWCVVDDLLGEGVHSSRMAWTLPDSSWKWDVGTLHVELQENQFRMHCEGISGKIGIFRAGEHIAGDVVEGPVHLWGWRSPTYAVKEPALSVVREGEGELPLRFLTYWAFGDADLESVMIDWNEPGEGSTAIAAQQFGVKRLDIDDAHFINPPSFRRTG